MKFSSSAFQRFEACACMSVMITRVRPLTWTLTRKCRCMVVRRSTSHSRHVLCRWGCGGSRLWSCWSASGSAQQWTTSCEKDYPQMENTQGRWPGVDVLQVPPELRPRNAQWNGKNPRAASQTPHGLGCMSKVRAGQSEKTEQVWLVREDFRRHPLLSKENMAVRWSWCAKLHLSKAHDLWGSF